MKRKHLESMAWLDAEPAMIMFLTSRVEASARHPRLPTATGKTKRFSVTGSTKFYNHWNLWLYKEVAFESFTAYLPCSNCILVFIDHPDKVCERSYKTSSLGHPG